MKKITVALLSTGISLVICSCSNKDEINSLKRQLSFEQAKLALSNSKDQSNAISKVDYLLKSDEITFEDGVKISIDNSLIDHIDKDSINWLATFYFKDGTSTSAFIFGKLDISDSNILVNPYRNCPLSALAKIQTPIKGSFKIIIHGKAPNGVTISKTFDTYGYSHELPILGLYQNYNNQIEFVFSNQNGIIRNSKMVSISTGPIDDNPNIKINSNNLGLDHSGIYMITDLRLGFDQTGEIRWSYSGDSHTGLSFMHKLANGNMVSMSDDALTFTELTMLGQALKTYDVPGGIHHDIIEMPSGNFLVTSNSNSEISVEDLIVEIDRNSKLIVKSWDINEILDPSRKTLPDVKPIDWLHMNSLYYDASDKSIIFSSRSQSAVVKIDYSSGELKWILGNPNFWNSSSSKFLLKPVDSEGEPVDISSQDFWPYGQHAAQRLQNGNIIMYDDGDFRGYYDNPNVPQASYSRAVEYAIDEQAKTIQLVWEFDNNKSQFTAYTGFVQHLSNSNRIIAYMGGAGVHGATGPKIVEIDKYNQIQFDADINPGKFYYRGWKLDLYQGIK